MNIIRKKYVSDNLSKYCPIAKEHDVIEVTDWSNGEGWDIYIKDKFISLTRGELDAINYLTKCLDYQDEF